MRADQAADLQRCAVERGLDWCVVGGWGVDALLGRQTREHDDLDVLVPLAGLPTLLGLCEQDGFRLAHVWEESRPLPGRQPLLGEPVPSAFVLVHDDGRSLDVHVHDEAGDGVVVLWDTDLVLTRADLAAAGRLDGVPVRCLTAAAQLRAHAGYDLPPAHAEDVRALERLVER